MAAIPAQLAQALPESCVRLKTTVSSVQSDAVTLDDGSTLVAKRVIVATENQAQQRLLGLDAQAEFIGVTALHVALPGPAPTDQPWLFLPDQALDPIASISFPSLVAAGYAPQGRDLATIAVLKDGSEADLWSTVQQHLRTLWGADVDEWELIHTDHLRYALPRQRPVDLTEQPIRAVDGIVLCGDAESRPGIGPALASGHAAALHVLE